MLGGVLGVVATAVGCAPAASPSGQGGRTTSKGSASAGQPRAVSPDVAVAISAASQVRQAADLLHRTVRRHPRLRGRLTALSAVHDTHLRLLRQAVPPGEHEDRSSTTARQAVPPRAAAAVDGVVRVEHGLRQSLEGLAVRAQSGEFARLLAAMSAAVGQQLALLAGDGAAR